ncbi:MAG: hypothetical protein AB1411_16000 [Nitrospirota bacterium]
MVRFMLIGLLLLTGMYLGNLVVSDFQKLMEKRVATIETIPMP